MSAPDSDHYGLALVPVSLDASSMATGAREALLVSLPAVEAEQALAGVITAVKDRVVIGPNGQSRASTPREAKTHLNQWLAPYSVIPITIEVLLGDRDLPSTWRLAYLHS